MHDECAPAAGFALSRGPIIVGDFCNSLCWTCRAWISDVIVYPAICRIFVVEYLEEYIASSYYTTVFFPILSERESFRNTNHCDHRLLEMCTLDSQPNPLLAQSA